MGIVVRSGTTWDPVWVRPTLRHVTVHVAVSAVPLLRKQCGSEDGGAYGEVREDREEANLR